MAGLFETIQWGGDPYAQDPLTQSTFAPMGGWQPQPQMSQWQQPQIPTVEEIGQIGMTPFDQYMRMAHQAQQGDLWANRMQMADQGLQRMANAFSDPVGVQFPGAPYSGPGLNLGPNPGMMGLAQLLAQIGAV